MVLTPQKNQGELEKVKGILESMAIKCGKIHNPSAAIDPDYWRFYVRAGSYQSFAILVGSWHPRKEIILQRILDQETEHTRSIGWLPGSHLTFLCPQDRLKVVGNPSVVQLGRLHSLPFLR